MQVPSNIVYTTQTGTLGDSTDSTSSTSTTSTVPVTLTTTEPVASVKTLETTEPRDLEADVAKWKALSRKHEGESKANADKAKAYDTLEEANKTELQKAADRAAAAETELSELRSRALRAEVGAAKGIPVNLLVGNTIEELEASADALILFKGNQPKPDMGGGARGGSITGASTQLTESDVKKLYADKKHDEIEAARLDGRLNTYLGILPNK